MRGRVTALLLLLAAGVGLAAFLAVALRPVTHHPGAALPDRQILCRDSKARCRLTVLVRLDAAPFPFQPGAGEGFWAGRDATRRLYRRFRTTKFYRVPHYVDDRVLVHVTPHRPQGGPPVVVLYLHGHNADLVRDVIGRRRVIDQVNASGRNVILVAPQMAWRAVDSHPGKLGRDGGALKLVNAAVAALKSEGGPSTPVATVAAQHPVLIVGYSGGWLAAMWSTLRGEFEGRLRGVLLLDAWFGPVERWARWKIEDGAKVFFVGLGGRRTVAAGLKVESALLRGGAAVAKRLPALLDRQSVILETLTPHADLPISGPPKWPIAEVLRRLKLGKVAAQKEGGTPDPAQIK